ncbi:MAG: hypothetical protein GW772_02420 [Flavobacteriia bacterium]|nr:hypothetical protein [Flavobacteriia bacterium]OIP46152.1 MAG: hypothetical protein AUK46_10180 [Flavobacteriaceae bacterium CG2_30_31_66]PIV96956.1 MAG: hypothetical protein COW43_05940 [Flavobacteriaceae bacterium CG17_big_fil_post_rev_8_21_14_2_50_31_13]PIY15262.1 MAG: hypothetical protein COZ16_05335 [Flavobacteriaceae bacterium CG_4_10_14_3_um_filter_31_253]PIZ12014.1 MAG: hypothetical protein COY55_02200 [Flavobacteriaceae bacterium CG_4_10_14_0_8_um_filter_31_99]PJC09457.1 MAG: hypot
MDTTVSIKDIKTKSNEIKGDLVHLENEIYYKISNSHLMRPFFMSIVSDSNHWMFISSNGGLTAGRKDANNSLFPYYTDDKITELAETTGSKSLFRIHKNNQILLWEPFSEKQEGLYKITRNLYKNEYGNKLIFEEINQDLGVTFKYQWNSSDEFGFVRKATFINNCDQKISVEILDGLENIIPFGVGADLQAIRSNLVDAYKKSELEAESGIGIFALSAIIVDKAEPSEALKANIVWSLGLKNPTYLLSSQQLSNFRKGIKITQEEDIKAERGAYFINTTVSIEVNSENSWMQIANVNQTVSDIIAISEMIKNDAQLENKLTESIQKGTENLISLAAASDALQLSNDPLINTRHFSNTLFNIMRGGIFDDNYTIEKQDFIVYMASANKPLFVVKKEILNNLPEIFTEKFIREIADNDHDKDFKRLCFEYLPLKFSRRHGDPSRPWNRFSINTKSEIDGSKILDYEGNWRDIFQNWEALAHSYPEFIENMIHKFLNATTFEGYNPYRITKGGFDWEVIEEHDPWSYIGYWGDHQIIYLLKFLEFIENHYPSKLASLFNQEVFVYANVPYKIKSYEDILKNPKDTIDFDHHLNHKIDEKRKKIGVDGALLTDKNDTIHRVNLVEKLLVTVLAKISNFIPEGGIWLNTQRPEWNDANNALVGNGVSMVTLYYLRRFVNFFEKVVENSEVNNIDISEEVAQLFSKIVSTLDANTTILSGKVNDKDRKRVLDGLGIPASNYREFIYKNGFSSEKSAVNRSSLLHFFEITKNYLDHSIRANKREDNMYHAYNLMTIENANEVSISYLSEMLEGQVAALSSGYLTPKQALSLLDGLKRSSLFRPDQYSYILYPNKELPRFLKKNNIPITKVQQSELLQKLVKDNNKLLIEQDVLGNYHFNGGFNNANSVKKVLEILSENYTDLVEKDTKFVLDVFEEIFDHKSFTGRSGTFFGYEGLGSIYWHMVSKLLLAVQENCLLAVNSGEDKVVIGKLLDHYYEINAGIGVHKSPELYGAFPTDAYSHTPATKGAQQPGMTGQVKEDILSRIGELGVFVENGKIEFKPSLLKKSEFLESPQVFDYLNVKNKKNHLKIEKNQLCFTYCQVPVVYQLSNKEMIEVVLADSTKIAFDGLSLDTTTSTKIFDRTNEIHYLIVSIIK